MQILENDNSKKCLVPQALRTNFSKIGPIPHMFFHPSPGMSYAIRCPLSGATLCFLPFRDRTEKCDLKNFLQELIFSPDISRNFLLTKKVHNFNCERTLGLGNPTEKTHNMQKLYPLSRLVIPTASWRLMVSVLLDISSLEILARESISREFRRFSRD